MSQRRPDRRRRPVHPQAHRDHAGGRRRASTCTEAADGEEALDAARRAAAGDRLPRRRHAAHGRHRGVPRAARRTTSATRDRHAHRRRPEHERAPRATRAPTSSSPSRSARSTCCGWSTSSGATRPSAAPAARLVALAAPTVQAEDLAADAASSSPCRGTCAASRLGCRRETTIACCGQYLRMPPAPWREPRPEALAPPIGSSSTV